MYINEEARQTVRELLADYQGGVSSVRTLDDALFVVEMALAAGYGSATISKSYDSYSVTVKTAHVQYAHYIFNTYGTEDKSVVRAFNAWTKKNIKTKSNEQERW